MTSGTVIDARPSPLPVWLLGMLLLAPVIGCSSGGGGDSAAGPSPAVAGSYAFNTGVFQVRCSDGSGGMEGGIGFTVRVTQSGNRIAIENVNPVIAPGFTVISSTGMNGSVAADGYFVARQRLSATIDGVPGTLTVDYDMDGQFAPGGWAGDYAFSVFFHALGGSCTYATTFSGTRLSAAAAAAPRTGPYDLEDQARYRDPRWRAGAVLGVF